MLSVAEVMGGVGGIRKRTCPCMSVPSRSHAYRMVRVW